MTVPASSVPADIARLSFEAALAELEELVRKLETGKSKLDEAVGDYERGSLLKRHCETKLREAQARIEQIAVGADGKVAVTSFAS